MRGRYGWYRSHENPFYVSRNWGLEDKLPFLRVFPRLAVMQENAGQN